MDLTSVVHYERDFPFNLIHPATVGTAKPQELLDEDTGKPITLRVRHIDCQAAQEVAEKRRAASVLLDADDAPDEADLYAACISGWDGEINMGPLGKLPYTPENAARILRHPACKWVFAQVRNAVLRIGNFTDD